MPPRNEVRTGIETRTAEAQQHAAPEAPSRKFYDQFENFLARRALNGGLGAPELFAVRDLAITANARLRFHLAATEGKKLAQERSYLEAELTDRQRDELQEYRILQREWRQPSTGLERGRILRDRLADLGAREEFQPIFAIDSSMNALETEAEYAERVLDQPPRHRWSSFTNQRRYQETLDAYEAIEFDLEMAHETEVIGEFSALGRTDINLDEVSTTRQRRIVKYLQTKRRALETDVRTEGIGEVDDHTFDIDTFFARMEELSRSVPHEDEQLSRTRELAVFDIIFYLRAKSRLEEAYVRDTLKLSPGRLEEMYPGFKPVKDEGNEHTLEAREHRFDQATYPRHTNEAYATVFDAWSQVQVPLERQMVFEKSDPDAMPDALREEVDRADQLPDRDEARQAVDTLISLSSTLELQSRFEDILTAKLQVDSERG